MIVVVNGCFDILHIGHIRLLGFARSFGGRVIVGINSDASITRLKGSQRPINNEQIRKEFLLSLKYVDDVIVFDEDNALNFLKITRPDIWVKGGDYDLNKVNQVEREFLQSIGCQIKFAPFVENFSTTNIINKIAQQ